MGFCIMFPHLCGLKSAEIGEMKQALLGVSIKLESELERTDNINERKNIIELYKKEAINTLKYKGMNYEVV